MESREDSIYTWEEEPDFDEAVTELSHIERTILPWWSGSDQELLVDYTEEDSKAYLNSFYLYPIYEFVVDTEQEDIPDFINERFRTLYSAAHGLGISLTLTIHSKRGNTTIYIGFKDQQNADTREYKEQFEALINGIIPGKTIALDESKQIAAISEGLNTGGLVTGIPIIKIDDEKQRINLSSVIRSLYGKDYTLSIISNPVSRDKQRIALTQLASLKDSLHSIAKQTVTDGLNEGESKAHGKSKTEGSSSTIGGSFSVIIASDNESETNNESTTISETIQKNTSVSKSVQIEKLNSLAIEFEKLADVNIERHTKGLNTGFWDTTVTFAAADLTTCGILANALIGEMAKPAGNLQLPPRYLTGDLGERGLFIPKTDDENSISPKVLASYITGDELSLLASLPAESVTGFEIKKMPKLALNDLPSIADIDENIVLGAISDFGNAIAQNKISFTEQDLNKHVFISGLTGSGKTTTVKSILKQLSLDPEKETVPFLVLESAKREYRQLLGDDIFYDNDDNYKLRVLKDKKDRTINPEIFTIGSSVNPISFNPFMFRKVYIL